MDSYLLSVLALVAYMAIGVVLAAIARHSRPLTTVILFVFVASAGVIANSIPWLEGFRGPTGVATWLLQGFYWYGAAAIAFLGAPFACTFVLLHFATRPRHTDST